MGIIGNLQPGLKEAIINVTNECPYSCTFCLLNAKKRGKHINPIKTYAFLAKSRELYPQFNYIDISGGDPLFTAEGRRITYYLCNNWLELGSRTRCGISTTGFKREEKISFIKKLTKKYRDRIEIELTIDALPDFRDVHRGPTYNEDSLLFAEDLTSFGVEPTIVTVVRKDNLQMIKELYSKLKGKLGDMFNLSLILYYPVGRGTKLRDLLLPNLKQLRMLIDEIRELINNEDINILLHRSIRYVAGLEGPNCQIPYQIGILPSGDVVLCPWGLDKDGNPFDWNKIGNLNEEDPIKILEKRERMINALWSRLISTCLTREYGGNSNG